MTKKILLSMCWGMLTVVLVMSLALAGCKPSPAPAPSPAPKPAPAPAPTPTPAPKPAPAPTPAPSPTAAPKVEAIKWKAQGGMAPKSFAGMYHQKFFCDLVNERAKGRLTIEYFTEGTLVAPYDQFDAVRKNTVQVAMGMGGYNTKWIPETDIEQGLPGAFASVEDFNEFFMTWKNSAFYKLMDELYREKGTHLLRSYCPYDNVLMTRGVISSIDEIKGKKIRASGAYLDLVKNLGAAPVTLAMGELYLALQTGTIDGIVMPNYTLGTAKYWDVCKALIMPAFGHSGGDIYVNLEAYNSLPKDLQEIVEQAAVDAAANFAKNRAEQTQGLLDKGVKEYGVKIVTLPAADFTKIRKASEPIVDKAAALSPRGAKLVELIKEYNAAKK